MRRPGRIMAVGLRAAAIPTSRRIAPTGDTTASRDRAILDLWDLDWPVDMIAAELRIDVHLVEQAVALFGDTEGSIA